MSRSNEQNKKIATAVGEFMRVAMSNPGPGGRMSEKNDHLLSIDGAEKLEKLLLAFCAEVQDEANKRVARATEDLRDRFAQAALTGFMSAHGDSSEGSHGQEVIEKFAEIAYLTADAMLARRKQTA